MSRQSARHGTLKQDAGTKTTPAQSSTTITREIQSRNSLSLIILHRMQKGRKKSDCD